MDGFNRWREREPAQASLLMVGPGHRTPETLLRLDERDRFLRQAAGSVLRWHE